MEERPAYTVDLLRKFIDSPQIAATTPSSDAGEERITPTEFKFPQRGNPGTGSSGVGGIETVVLKGDPNQKGVYTILLRVPAHTQIAAHSHATIASRRSFLGHGILGTAMNLTNQN